MPQATNRKQHALPRELRQRLVHLAEARGLRPLADEIGVSAQTFACLAAGIRVNASTVALVQRRLAELGVGRVDAEGEPDDGFSFSAPAVLDRLRKFETALSKYDDPETGEEMVDGLVEFAHAEVRSLRDDIEAWLLGEEHRADG